MVLCAVPWRLLVMGFLLLPLVGLLGFEIIVVGTYPWWQIPWLQLLPWIGVVGGVTFGLILLIALAKGWAFHAVALLAGLWSLINIFLLTKFQEFWLALVVVGITVYWVGYLSALRTELRRSFLYPKRTWYQGLPVAVPGLKCEVILHAQSVNYLVSRLDRQGVFVFKKRLNGVDVGSLRRSGPVAIRVEFESNVVSIFGKVIRVWENGVGIGLKFVNLSGDSQKDLGDMVEKLRGCGYV